MQNIHIIHIGYINPENMYIRIYSVPVFEKVNLGFLHPFLTDSMTGLTIESLGS